MITKLNLMNLGTVYLIYRNRTLERSMMYNTISKSNMLNRLRCFFLKKPKKNRLNCHLIISKRIAKNLRIWWKKKKLILRNRIMKTIILTTMVLIDTRTHFTRSRNQGLLFTKIRNWKWKILKKIWITR